MHQRSIVRIGVPLAVAALALSACGSRGDSGSSSGGGTGGGATKTAKIGVIAPLTGDLSALGKGIQHSVELAVKQANDTNAVPGWKLEVSSVDDEAKADVGKNAATKLASDDTIIGVVGNLNSSVSQQTQPIFAAANITQVSPANTNPALTIGARTRRTRSGPTRRTSAPAPRMPSRVRSPRSTCSARASRTSRRSTTRRPTARVSSTRSRRSSRRAAARSPRPRRSTPTSRTTRPSCRRSPRRARRPSTTAASTRRVARSRSR